SCLRLAPDQVAASTLNSAKMNTASHLTIAEREKHYETPRSHPIALAWIISSALFPWARPGHRQAPDCDYDSTRHSKRCRARTNPIAADRRHRRARRSEPNDGWTMVRPLARYYPRRGLPKDSRELC